jgi:hypothetical protein
VQVRAIEIDEADDFLPLVSDICLQIGDILLILFRVVNAPFLLAFCDSFVEGV